MRVGEKGRRGRMWRGNMETCIICKMSNRNLLYDGELTRLYNNNLEWDRERRWDGVQRGGSIDIPMADAC